MTTKPDFSQNLFIEVDNGRALNHPISGHNLRLFIPDFDFDNPPAPFFKFIRKLPPPIGPFETFNGVSYELVNGLYFTDTFHITTLSEEEKISKKTEWLANHAQPFPSWIFNESNLSWDPPIPYPADGKEYLWQEKTQNWVTETKPQEIKWPELQTSTGNVQISVKGAINTRAELDNLQVTDIGDAYSVIELRSIVAFNGTEWVPIWSWNLSACTIIEAKINDVPVKVLGVLKDLNQLPFPFTGQIGDCYIIDDLNELRAWDGTTWNYTTPPKAY